MKTPPKLPIQGAQDRSKRRVTERDKGIEHMNEVYATGDYQLNKKVIDALRAAQGQHPLVVRNAIPQEALKQIATAWEDFVARDEEEYDGPAPTASRGLAAKDPNVCGESGVSRGERRPT